jgi:hypothetical protein
MFDKQNDVPPPPPTSNEQGLKNAFGWMEGAAAVRHVSTTTANNEGQWIHENVILMYIKQYDLGCSVVLTWRIEKMRRKKTRYI